AAGPGHRAERAPACLELADRARQRHRFVEAESLYSRALGQLDDSKLQERMDALRGRALMRERVSRLDPVEDRTTALSTARSLGNREAEVEIIMETATALDWMVEYVKSTELMKEAATVF